MSTDIQLFDFHGQDVRITDRNGNPWFVFTDLCSILGYANSSKTKTMIRGKYISNIELGLTGPPTIIVNEAGMNQLIMRSNKPEAEKLQDWVYEEVLPSLRKTGTYTSEPTDHPMVVQAKVNLQLTERFVQMEARQKVVEDEAREAREMALLAFSSQQWITISQYVALHKLDRQLPVGTARQQYDKFLSAYCRERNWSMYNHTNVNGITENTYPAWSIVPFWKAKYQTLFLEIL